ncbi:MULTISPECIES: hypothetical protein [unclassified Mesorhizobium]|uniref:hypothetical protein n=1 Tax=unclassified Mesorhizobium TaxID=325217 RepID=UPI000FD361E2|nr:MULTISPECIES: hypothetical protein [unclassified Mesorhizobium]RVB72138.1 hypothetical protein EN885_30295 [Mesorhizobium sp. M6A.T.Cr.TU.014.01.1.1]RWP96298.1 MAG: hypothetical protein EOR91_31305 [Mesorhizobium sp.]RWP96407.1 MAG: hypothetical protein EOR90_29960 [Mesorhizobium sp.]
MTTSISMGRLRKIVAEANAAYAASRQATENFRNAKSAVRAVEARINPQLEAGNFETKNWDREPKGTWPAEYRKAREVLAEAEAAVERQHETTQHAGRIKTRAIEFARASGIELPADMKDQY